MPHPVPSRTDPPRRPCLRLHRGRIRSLQHRARGRPRRAGHARGRPLPGGARVGRMAAGNAAGGERHSAQPAARLRHPAQPAQPLRLPLLSPGEEPAVRIPEPRCALPAPDRICRVCHVGCGALLRSRAHGKAGRFDRVRGASGTRPGMPGPLRRSGALRSYGELCSGALGVRPRRLRAPPGRSGRASRRLRPGRRTVEGDGRGGERRGGRRQPERRGESSSTSAAGCRVRRS